MKRIDPLLQIAESYVDILKKYAEARRMIIKCNDGYPVEFIGVEQNKRGHRKTTSLDEDVFHCIQHIMTAINDAREKETGYTIDELLLTTLSKDHSCGWTRPNRSTGKANIRETVYKALNETVEIEEESGRFVYEYVKGYYGEERDE